MICASIDAINFRLGIFVLSNFFVSGFKQLLRQHFGLFEHLFSAQAE